MVNHARSPLLVPEEVKLTRSGMSKLEVLVLELFTIDGLSPGPVSGREVAPLAHKVGDDAVERGPLVAEPLLPGAEGAEVLRRLGHHVVTELENKTFFLVPSVFSRNASRKVKNLEPAF